MALDNSNLFFGHKPSDIWLMKIWTYLFLPVIPIGIFAYSFFGESRSLNGQQFVFAAFCSGLIYGLHKKEIWAWHVNWLGILALAAIPLKFGVVGGVLGGLWIGWNFLAWRRLRKLFSKDNDEMESLSFGDHADNLQRAKHGDAQAQFNVGANYRFGEGAPQDHVQSAYWFLKAAEQGKVEAQHIMGMLCEAGEGLPRDYSQAFHWHSKAANQGYMDAQASLGYLYYYGHGVSQDYAEAHNWFSKAANTGHAGAQSGLGFLYKNGLGVPQDYAQALHWYGKAAEQGDESAQYHLGLMYGNGHGVPKDFVQAYMWLNLANAGGTTEKAAKSIAFFEERMTPNQIEQAQALSRDWLARTR